MEPEIAAYNAALVAALRSANPHEVRRFAAEWGQRLANRGLQQLAKASDEAVERRMWMMIYDRPDLSELHDQAEEWLAAHEPEEPA